MTARRRWAVLAVCAVWACEDAPPPAESTALPATGGAIPGLQGLEGRRATPPAVPRELPGGGFRIEGGPPLSGDPISCAAFHACCDVHNGQVTPAGLACGLAPAAGNGDCTKALESVRGIFREHGIGPPPGCM